MSRPTWAQQNLQNKPENVLAQALDLDAVGKSSDAFQLIAKMLTTQPRAGPMNKAPQRTWSQPLEDLVIKAVELAVKLRASSHDVRSVLQAFKSTCIPHNATAATVTHPQSFVRVVKLLLAGVDKTVNFQHLAINTDDDNDADDTPEALQRLAFPKATLEEQQLTAQPSTTQAAQHKKNQSSTALRYFWDIYRTVLELVRIRERYTPAPGGGYHCQPGPQYYQLLREVHEETLCKVYTICRQYNLASDFRRFTSAIRKQEPGTGKDGVRYAAGQNKADDLTSARHLHQVAFMSTLYSPLGDVDEATAQDILNKQYEMILKAKFAQLNAAVVVKNWFEIVNTFVDINDILSTVQDVRSPILASPTLILIQQRFADFLWSGNNTFLHAFALLALYNRLVNAQKYHGEEDPEFLNKLLTQVRQQAQELNLPANSWVFADLDTIYSGVILSSILANDATANTATTTTVFGGLLGNSLTNGTANSKLAAYDDEDESSVIQNMELFKYSTLLMTDDEEEDISNEKSINDLNNLIQIQTKILIAASPESNTKETFKLMSYLNNKTLTPLRFRKLLTPLIATLSANVFLTHYMQPLYNTIVRSILLSLSGIYTIITIDKFTSMLPVIPTVDTTCIYNLEKIITKVSLEQNLFAKVDHITRTLYLRPFPTQIEQTIMGTLSNVATQLVFVAPSAKAQNDSDRQNERQSLFEHIKDWLDQDVAEVRQRHQALVNRRKESETAKQQEEERRIIAEKEAAEKKQAELEAKQEEMRLRREKEAAKKQAEELAAAKKKQIADALQKSVTDATEKDFKLTKEMRKQLSKLTGSDQDLDKLSEVQLRDLMKQVEIQKHREFNRLRREHRKTVDFTVRALRCAQREKILATKEAKAAALQAQIDAAFEKEKEAHRAKWEKDIAEKKRFEHLAEQRELYRKKVMEKRQAEYEAKLAAFEAEERRQAEEQAKKEEEEAAKKAEEERIKAEEAAAKKAEEEAKKAAENKSWREQQEQRAAQEDAPRANKFMSKKAAEASSAPQRDADGFKSQRPRGGEGGYRGGARDAPAGGAPKSKFSSSSSKGYKFGGDQK
eukprot:UN01673